MAVALGAADEPGWTDLEIGAVISSYSLEGPAATGYTEIEEVERAAGGGLFVRGRFALGGWAHIAGDATAERIAGDVTVVRAHLAPGIHWHPGGGVALFAEAGVAFALVDGLEEYEDRRPAAEGDGGTDVGLHAVVGVRQRIAARLEWHALFGYQAYGEEDYPAAVGGGASGDGPVAAIGAALDVGERWAVTAGWTGIWVEDAGFAVDLDANQFRFGLRRSF
jgi:opacity protein-like surface antigen